MTEKARVWFPIAGFDYRKVGLILSLILIVSSFHFLTSTEYRYLHEIYQRIYYIPILLAAFWYGPLVGFLTALLVSSIYVFHIRMDWHHVPAYTFNQYAEIFLYHAIALVIGFLSTKEKRHREQLERTSAELANAYQQLQDTFQQLRKADRLAALGQLSAGIAHEIRNPLGSVKGSIEILEEEITPDHPKYEFVQIVKEETARLDSIVTEFLEFARPPRPAFRPCSINELVESTLILVHKETAASRIEVVKDLSVNLPLISMDPDQIRQVLLNLFLNAVQAMPDGGILKVTSHPRGQRVIVEVADTGVGVEEADRDRIFDPFFSTKPNGTGMGLSISHQLVENHGGVLSARVNPKQGMTFCLELPSD
jgi:signal transduction histidine kinase